MLVKLMEGVEDIPEVVLTRRPAVELAEFPAIISTRWRPPLRHRLRRRRCRTRRLRVFVMGQRGADREQATEADRRRMARACGRGDRRRRARLFHLAHVEPQTLDGRSIPTLTAAEAELAAIARAIGALGKGWLQVISDFDDQRGRVRHAAPAGRSESAGR